MKKLLVLLACGGALLAACARPQPATFTPDSDPWLMERAVDFNRPGFAAGAKISVLQGNPADTGYFVLRLSLPDGYAIPPHWHPTTEIVTVLRGTFLLGMGERADRSTAKSMAVGEVQAIEPRMAHYAWAQGNTVVQVHGSGPFQLNLVETR